MHEFTLKEVIADEKPDRRTFEIARAIAKTNQKAAIDYVLGYYVRCITEGRK